MQKGLLNSLNTTTRWNWKEPMMTQQSGKGIWKERSAYSEKDWMHVRYFNENSVSLQGNGTCVKPKVQSGASYIPTVIRRSYVYGTLKRIAGYGLNAAQMQLTAGRHLIMELKAAGWIGIKQMIWGAGQHILDKETRCALVRFIDIMEQRHHIE